VEYPAVSWLRAALTLDGWRVTGRDFWSSRAERGGLVLTWWDQVVSQPSQTARLVRRDGRGRWERVRSGLLAAVLRCATWRCASVGEAPAPRMSAWGWMEPCRRVVEVTTVVGSGSRRWWGLADMPPCVQAVCWDWLCGGEAAEAALWDLLADLPPGRGVCPSDLRPPIGEDGRLMPRPDGRLDSERVAWVAWVAEQQAALAAAQREGTSGRE
jgi:hypothetical protein